MELSPEKKIAGILAPLFGLRSESDLGIGDVAVTRAKDELYLTYPHMRLTGGYGDVFQRPSRFLKEIPNKLVEDWQVKRS